MSEPFGITDQADLGDGWRMTGRASQKPVGLLVSLAYTPRR